MTAFHLKYNYGANVPGKPDDAKRRKRDDKIRTKRDDDKLIRSIIMIGVLTFRRDAVCEGDDQIRNRTLAVARHGFYTCATAAGPCAPSVG